MNGLTDDDILKWSHEEGIAGSPACVLSFARRIRARAMEQVAQNLAEKGWWPDKGPVVDRAAEYLADRFKTDAERQAQGQGRETIW